MTDQRTGVDVTDDEPDDPSVTTPTLQVDPTVEVDLEVPTATGPELVAHAGTPDEVATARRRLRWWRELVYIGGLYALYSFVRNTFGSNGSAHGINVSPLAVAHAYGHAKDVIWFERSVGLFVEPHLQRWYLSLPHHGFIRFWNIYYGTFHFIVPIIALVWLFRHDPVHYAKWRNTAAITTALALIGFAGYSLMPPRLLDSTMVYGACNARYGLTCHHYGIVDTLVRYGGLWNFDSGTVANVSNQYAAMPSLHIGWSTWCALVLLPRVRHTWSKVLVALYPVATLFCILVTGNHYWVDAVAGLLFLAVGYLLGSTLAKATSRWSDRRDARKLAAQPASV
jgi:hypothetical protein